MTDAAQAPVLAILAFLMGFVKTGFGVGSGVLFTPLLALVLPPRSAAALTAPLMFVTDILALQVHWRRWDWRQVRVLVPTAVLGIVLGTSFLARAPAGLARKGVGILALGFAVQQLVRLWRAGGDGPALQGRSSPLWAGAVGLIGGVAGAVAHAGGMVFSIYLLPRMQKATFVASLALILGILDIVKLISYVQTGVMELRELWWGLLLAPLMAAGSWLGGLANRRLSTRRFLYIATGLVGCTGIALTLR